MRRQYFIKATIHLINILCNLENGIEPGDFSDAIEWWYEHYPYDSNHVYHYGKIRLNIDGTGIDHPEQYYSIKKTEESLVHHTYYHLIPANDPGDVDRLEHIREAKMALADIVNQHNCDFPERKIRINDLKYGPIQINDSK